MAKRFLVFEKYSQKPRRQRGRIKTIGGKARFVERNTEWSNSQSAMQKIVSRVHNDEEYFLRKQTKFKAYYRFFLNRPYIPGLRDDDE